MRKRDGEDRRITLRIDEETAKEIDAYIEDKGMSFTEFARRAIREKLDRDSAGGAAELTRDEIRMMIRETVAEYFKEGH